MSDDAIVGLEADLSDITGIASHSCHVKPGYLYMAIRGEEFNGEDFIDEAIAKGATIIALADDAKISKKDGIKYIFTKNTRKYLAKAAASHYKPQPQNIVGITGTSGKTSTAEFYRQICNVAGRQAASIGTLGVNGGSIDFLGAQILAMTTPDTITMHGTLQVWAMCEIKNIALEVSSHGLVQHRVDGINFSAAAFTNFTQDHLDYHITFASYFAAKMRLFSELLPAGAYAILNRDIPEFNKIKDICINRGHKLITYGMQEADITFRYDGRILHIRAFGKDYATEFRLPGQFQQYNAACALGLVAASDIDVYDAVQALSLIRAVDGRLQQVANYNDATIFVDYAHKPDALEKVLLSAREFTKGRLHVIFGCGGDRDHSKRPIMGEIALKLADVTIVTDDNPRTEDADKIRRDIIGTHHAQIIEIPDRREAITYGIAQLQSGDVLIVAGKGHEEYQIIGEKKHYFSDKEEVKKAVSLLRDQMMDTLFP